MNALAWLSARSLDTSKLATGLYSTAKKGSRAVYLALRLTPDTRPLKAPNKNARLRLLHHYKLMYMHGA